VEASLALRRETLIAARAAADDAPPSDAELRAIASQHAVSDAHRCFLLNEHGEPSTFEFVMEVETRQRPRCIVFRGLRVLYDKLHVMHSALTGQPDTEKMDTASYPNMDDFHHITVRGEDHTIGNLLQSMMYKLWVRDGGSKDVSFIGYHQPHPLEDHIVFKIKCVQPRDDVRLRFAEGTAWVMDRLHEVMLAWTHESGLDKAGVVEVNEWLMRIRPKKKMSSE
jgi:DNA-directed RNA polymerase subunit L